MIFEDFRAELDSACSGLGIEAVTKDKAEKLFIHTAELSEKGKMFNLTAICDPVEVVNKHIADCVFAASVIEKLTEGKNTTLIDIGSGGGFPSLPIAITCDNVSVTALDSTAKKCTFIKGTAELCGVDIDTVAQRAEEAVANRRESFDFATARAVAPLNILAELCASYIKVGGYFVSMKGSAADGEAAEAESAMKKLSLELCDKVYYEIKDGGKRCILVYKKTAKTSDKYPRNYSQIKKKPL